MSKVEMGKSIHFQMLDYLAIWTPSSNVNLLHFFKAKKYPSGKKNQINWHFFHVYKWIFFPISTFSIIEKIAFFKAKYLEYFQWKYDYYMYQKDEWCRLCEKLHSNSEPVKVYQNMTNWFYYKPDGNWQCSDGSERDYYSSIIS